MSARQKSLRRNLKETPEGKKSEVQNLNVINEELFPMPHVDEFGEVDEFNNNYIIHKQCESGGNRKKKAYLDVDNFKNFY
jgi:hypothetical protein